MSWPWPPTLTYFWKKHMIINFLTESDQAFITHVYSLWQDLSVSTEKFLTGDLDLQLWLTFEKNNLGINIWTERDGAFILRIDIPYFFIVRLFCPFQNFWCRDLDLYLSPSFEKKFYRLCYICNFSFIKRDYVFILHMYISYSKTFLSIPK